MNWHAAALSILWVIRDLFLNPLFYAGFALAFWDLRRTSTFERKFFGIRATRPLRLTIIRGVEGLMIGIVISALLIASGVVVDLWEVAAVSILGLVLGAIQLRFVSPVYSISLLSALSLVISKWGPSAKGFFGIVVSHLGSFHVVGWSGVLCGVMLGEMLLVAIVGRHSVSPVVTVSKRGRGIGALWIQLAFMVPLVIPTVGTVWSAPSYVHSPWHLLWTLTASSFALLGMPVLVGFSGLFDNLRPRVAVQQTAAIDGLSAVLAGGGAYLGTIYDSGYAVLAPWLILAIREVSRWWLDHRQSLADPLFAPADEGVMVLAVLPDSWAARLGVKPADTIARVNGVPVHSQYDLHFALNQNPAYAKLEVIDERGEIRFVSHTVYEGERAQLGLIFAPDGQSPRFVKAGGSGLLQSLYARLTEAGPGALSHASASAASINGDGAGQGVAIGGAPPPSRRSARAMFARSPAAEEAAMTEERPDDRDGLSNNRE
ncbi:PDZ domain-containing protein [Alicyclobacillus curvatus]|nr:PDZ domain-containing protein [Alicyclobacillus curvatus]